MADDDNIPRRVRDLETTVVGLETLTQAHIRMCGERDARITATISKIETVVDHRLDVTDAKLGKLFWAILGLVGSGLVGALVIISQGV